MKKLTPVLFLLSACQPLTDPCYRFSEDAPQRCTGSIVVDASDPAAPVFDVEETAAVTPNHVSVIAVDPEAPCAGGTGLWELKRFQPTDLPLAYGEPTARGREWINPDLAPDGGLVPLEEGAMYSVSFGAKDRLGGSSSAPQEWTAYFVAGDPDSVMLYDEACLSDDEG